MIFWATDNGALWEPFRRCSDEISEKTFARSEPDLMLLWKGSLLVVIEAKFRSPNRSDPKKRAEEQRKAKPYIGHASRYLNPEGANEAVLDGWYELLRNWALGAKLKESLSCESFVLVNLVRKRHEAIHGENPIRDFAERACLRSSNSQFAIAHWKDLIAAAPSISRHPDSDVLVSWARNKSELLGRPAFDF